MDLKNGLKTGVFDSFLYIYITAMYLGRKKQSNIVFLRITTISFDENWWKSPKIVIATLTPEGGFL
jgi:hypothetical protein